MSLVPMAEVLYLKAELKYVTLRTKSKEYLIEDSLVSIEEELAAHFVRVHRNALVARNAISGVERVMHTTDNDGDGEKPQEIWQVVLRDIDRNDAKFDADVDNRPKDYVSKHIRKKVLRWVYAIVTFEIAAVLFMIWVQWT